MNEGSLLRRTLLYIGTFAFGSLAVVGLLSFMLVSIATSVLPSRAPKDGEGARKEQAAEESEDGATASGKPSASKTSKSKRPRGALTEEESPNRTADKNE